MLPHMATSESSKKNDQRAASRERKEAVRSGDSSASRGSARSGGSSPQHRTLDLDDKVFEITFRDRERFRNVFERDVQTGGIFVPTEEPAAMDEVVQVEIEIEGVGSERLEARVVHSVPPSGEEVEGQNVLAGMGVQFSDVARAVEQLRQLLG